MKSKLLLFILFIFTISIYGQKYETGTIITKRYDTIRNVNIEKISNSKSLLHLNYVDNDGNNQSPSIETIKCYTRGDEKFIRIYYDCEMILVKVVEMGNKVNLYERNYGGITNFYIEKVYDELIKVPSSNGKFAKVISAFLSDSNELSNKIKSKDLTNIEEIVTLFNEG